MTLACGMTEPSQPSGVHAITAEIQHPHDLLARLDNLVPSICLARTLIGGIGS
jgi:hypothetical protein